MRKHVVIPALALCAVWLNSAVAQPDALPLPSDHSMLVIEDDKKPANKAVEAAPAPKEAAPATTAWPAEGCCDDCGKKKCHIDWCRKWTCEDLEMKPFEAPASFCGCKKFFHCPKKEEEKNGNGNGEKKEDEKKDEKKDGDKKDGDKKEEAKKDEEKKNGNGNGEEEKADEGPKTILMQILNCCSPCKYKAFSKKGNNVYGWLQQGFISNFDSPQDRVNFGPTLNWRSNDYRLNQACVVLENTLEQDDTLNFGYRIDLMGGTDTAFFASRGLFDHVTGFSSDSGFGFPSFDAATGTIDPTTFRNINRVGVDIPQMYLEGHIPGFLGTNGLDIRFGKFYTYFTYELSPAPQTLFYTHSYEYFFAMPFVNTGIVAIVHATDTVDVGFGVVRGWDVWEDNNDRPSYQGTLTWTSCDKRTVWATVAMTGPEQNGNNDNFRTGITSWVTRTFGDRSQWKAAVGGCCCWEANAIAAVTDATTGAVISPAQDVEWYTSGAYLFYTVSPKLILGARAEWFRDDDGVRTALFKRPVGFATNFWEVTLGVTYKPFQNLRIRPEVRYDWANNGSEITDPTTGIITPVRPYDDLQRLRQFTAAVDMIWEF